MPNDLDVIVLFAGFLDAYGKATDSERREFLNFISRQSRDDLIALADALREKAAIDDKSTGRGHRDEPL